MSADLAPKITDLKNLQDLAKIFALPMLAVAYILQTGLVVSIDETIWLSVNWQGGAANIWFAIFSIVVLKALFMAFCGMMVHTVIGLLHTLWSPLVYPLSAMCLFTLGLLGLFPPEDAVDKISSVSAFWFYACFVWGFYFIAMERQFNKG